MKQASSGNTNSAVAQAVQEQKMMDTIKANQALRSLKDNKALKKISEHRLVKAIPKPKLFGEFKDFLKEYKVIGLAVAFVMGMAATTLVKSLVDNVIMPLITPFIPGGEWQTAKLILGPIVISWGAFLAALINFIMIALAVFIIAKIILKEEKVTKK